MPKHEVATCMKLGFAAYDKLAERIKELEAVIEKIRLISRRSYKLPVTSVAAMKNLKIINQRAEQALKGGD